MFSWADQEVGGGGGGGGGGAHGGPTPPGIARLLIFAMLKFSVCVFVML